jgi:hypothetical protein
VAKKKSRTPPPPRTVQATKGRSGQVPRTPAARQGRRRPSTRIWLIGTGVVVVGVIAAVALATTLGGGSDTSALAAAGCVQETFPSQGRKHETELPADFTYNSFPATSGPHHPQAVLWNLYTEPVLELRVVHNLEHGGVVVQYGDQVPEATVDEITSWYQASDRNGIVVAPLPALGDKIALTAWTKLATCTKFDEKAFDAFVDLHRGKGPERIPLEAMTPGS